MDKINELQQIINHSRKIVFFGGAGVSTESGIPDFRSVDGLYNLKYKYPPEQIISASFFYSNLKEFYGFYKEKMIFLDAEPNITHIKLAQMRQKGILSAIVTQNIDGLHEMADKIVRGDVKDDYIYDIHGSILRNYCLKCHKFYDAKFVKESQGIPTCQCGGVIKPDVVLYEESLDETKIDKSLSAISQADTLIVGGTSLVVYPAAGFIRYFKGKNLIIIDKKGTQADSQATLTIHDTLGNVFSRLKI